jgi:hypothetical protein
MISRINLISILRNLVTFICSFITSLIIVRNIGNSKFYTEFIIFTSYGATFLFLSGALKETILYCNKGNTLFIYAVKQKIVFYKKQIIYSFIILFAVVLSLIFFLIRDPMISVIICVHIFSFYISETIQFTSVLTDQVSDLINFRLFASIFVLIITWIALKFGFNLVLYFNILFNTVIPLIFYLRLNRGSVEKTGENSILIFNFKLFLLIAGQYLITSFFTFVERFLFSKSIIDLNSYSISFGLTQNLSAIFLSYLTIESYSRFIKEEYKEKTILNNCILLFFILLPFCLICTTQIEPFIFQLFSSEKNTYIFISDLSLSFGITIWAVPAMAIQTMLARYLMSINKIDVFIKASLVTAIMGILLIGAAYLSNHHSYLRYCWMISQNIGLIIMLILGLNQSFSLNVIKRFLFLFILLIIIGVITPFLFATSNLIFNSIEILLCLLMSYLCIRFFLQKI